MRRFIVKGLFISALSFGMGLFAQNKLKLGLDAGYTYTQLNANLSNLTDSKYVGRYGFGINVSGEYLIWKSIFVSTGVSYLKKNYEFQRTGSRSGWYENIDNSFLSFPLMIGSYMINNPYESKGIWLKIAGGMYTDYWLDRKSTGKYPVLADLTKEGIIPYTSASGTYDFKKNENQLNRFGYGLQGQAQLGYSFGKLDLYGNYHYQYGLSDINISDKVKEHKLSTRSYMISLGVAYKFN